MTSLFISHSSADGQIADEIVRALREAGFGTVFMDADPYDGLVPGVGWERELYSQLRKADAVVFLATPASIASRWCAIEIGLARSIAKPIIPALLAGEERLRLLDDVQWVDLRSPTSDRFTRLIEGLRRLGADPSDSFAFDVSRPPYPGLEPFGARDAAVFYGRKREISELRDRMQPTLQRDRGQCLVVLGPSGSGKSSLVSAGLLPRLAQAPDKWLIAPPVVPGERPYANLARALATLLPAADRVEVPRVERRLREGSSAIIELGQYVADRAPGGGQRRIVVFLDQAEELVTRTSAPEAAAFLHDMRGALDLDSPIWIIAALRSDFLAPVLALGGGDKIIDDIYPVGPLHPARLSEVIEGPAERAGIEFEASLVQRMIADTVGGDSLPLLAFALRQLYERAGDRSLITVADYDDTGGVIGALRRQADGVVARLSRTYAPADIIRTLLYLVSIGDDGTAVRRPVPLASLTRDEQVMVGALVDARLLRAQERDGRTQVDVAHEALLRQWEPLAAAIVDARRNLEVRSEIERTARAWNDSGRDESYLPRGVRLVAARSADAGRSGAELGTLEQDFLTASQLYGTREVESARRSTRRLRRLALALAFLVVVSSGVAFFAVQQRATAERQRRVATGRGLVVEANAMSQSKPEVAIKVALAAATIDSGRVNDANLTRLLSQTRYAGGFNTGMKGLGTMALGQGGRYVAVGGEEQEAALWDRRDPSKPQRLTGVGRHDGGVNSVDFAQTRSLLATAGRKGGVTLWDVSDQSRPRELSSLASGSTVVGFRDETTLLTAGPTEAALWDVSDATSPRRLAGLPVDEEQLEYVVLSDNGKLVAVSSARRVTLINIAQPQHPRRVGTIDAKNSTVLAYSPDDKSLFVALVDGSVTSWDVGDFSKSGNQGRIPFKGSLITDMTFHPTRNLLGIGHNDGGIDLWDVSDRAKPVLRFSISNDSPVTSLAFDESRNLILSAGENGAVTAWGLEQTALPTRSVVVTGYATDASFSKSGTLLAVAGLDATLHDTSRTREAGELSAIPGQELRAISLAPNAGTLALGSTTAGITLWDVSKPRVPRSVTQLMPGSHVTSTRFSPDSSLLSVLTDQETASLWNVQDMARPTLLHVFEHSLDLAFSQDMGTAVTAGSAGDSLLWDITDAADPRLLSHFPPARSVALSPTGHLLALAPIDGPVAFWNVEDPGKPVLVSSLADSGPVDDIAFSADASTAVSSSFDGGLDIWDLVDPAHPARVAELPDLRGLDAVDLSGDSRTLVVSSIYDGALVFDLTARQDIATNPTRTACAIAHGGLSRDQWRQFVPDLPYVDTCRS